MLYQGISLTILYVLEKFVTLEKRMEDMEKNVIGVGRDLKEAFRADMEEGVQEIKKYINEGRETEAISKRNGELFFIGFYFVLNLFMN